VSLAFDASVIAAWALPDEHVPAADQIVAGLQPPAFVPSVFPFEIANTLLVAVRRGRLTPERARRALGGVWALPIVVDAAPLPDLSRQLLPLAEATGLSTYDAAYLELAQRLGLPLATIDQQLRQAAGQLGVALL